MTKEQQKKYEEALKKMQVAHKKEFERQEKMAAAHTDTHIGEQRLMIEKAGALSSFVNKDYRDAATEFLDIVEPLIIEDIEQARQDYKEAYDKYLKERKRVMDEIGAALNKRNAVFSKYSKALRDDFRKVMRFQPVPASGQSARWEHLGLMLEAKDGAPLPHIASLRRAIETGENTELQLEQQLIAKQQAVEEAKQMRKQEKEKKQAQSRAYKSDWKVLATES